MKRAIEYAVGYIKLIFFPSTFSGNAKWPFSLSHNRLQTGGWARQQNSTRFVLLSKGLQLTILTVKVMPLATEMAAVNMRLEAGALR